MTETSSAPAPKVNNAAQLFEAPRLAIEKLPQLRALFERTSAATVDEFKELFSAPVSCFLNQVEAGDSWDILDAYEECIAALFYVSEWDAQILMAMERRLLYAALDAMYGCDGTEPQIETVRPYSSLELQVSRDIFERMAACLGNAIAPLTEITLAFERMETEIEFNILGPQNVPSVFAQLLFQIFDGGGRMIILVPRAPLLPMRKKLERGTLRESQADDPRWTRQLQSRVSTAHIDMRALVNVSEMSLADVSEFRIGQVIPVEALSGTSIVLESASTPMFACELGQNDGKLCLKIDSTIQGPTGLTANVLSEAMRHWGGGNAGHKG